MRTFILDIIPKISRYSEKLDKLTALTDKHWVMIDDELNKKIVFIFRTTNNQLLISDNGRIEKGNWEYLGRPQKVKAAPPFFIRRLGPM